MMRYKLSEKALDYIIEEMIEVVENSKGEIFNISEESRKEYDQLSIELEDIKKKVIHYIEKGDQLEKNVRISRIRLSEVSKQFDRYSESDIREVYDSTYAMQADLALLRQEEEVLRERRDDIERRLLTLIKTIERADNLARKIAVILSYLNNDFKQVNEMLEEAKEKQEFGLKIIGAQEDERRKISREIHDGPAQMLANILLRSELVERSLREESTESALDEIKSIREMIRTSLYEVRRIIYDLRPMALDDLGLVPTIKKYIDQTADYNNITIEFISLGEKQRLQSKYEVALFRLMQEALQNAVNHAKASLIKVKLEIGKSYIILVIEDDGIGFDFSIKKENSFGLIGMKERVEMLEGTLRIETSEGNGTKIFIKIPSNTSDQKEKNVVIDMS